jgi:ribosomal protein L15
MLLSGKQKREKTRDGKIKKRDGIMTLVEAMGKINHTEYKRMRSQFRKIRQVYRELVVGGMDNNDKKLRELLKKRAEILDFLTRIENMKIISGKTEKQHLVANTRFHFAIETDSTVKLLVEPILQHGQNENDIVENNQSASSSDDSSDESTSLSNVYTVINLLPVGNYSIGFRRDTVLKKINLGTEIAPMLYGNEQLNYHKPISKWVPFLIGKFGKEIFHDDDDERLGGNFIFTILDEVDDTPKDELERKERLFIDDIRAYAIKMFGRDTYISFYSDNDWDNPCIERHEPCDW